MGKAQIIKKNICDWYEVDKFENVIQYAVKCSNTAGVDKYLSELRRKYRDYSSEMDILINKENPLLDNRFHMWNNTEKIKNICKWGSIASFFLIFINTFVNFPNALIIIICLGAFLGCIATIILKMASIVLKFRYNMYFKSVGDKATVINQKFLNDLPILWNKIDDLYLASLDPSHRETILMRRDQERHHQEAMRAQMQYQETMRAQIQHQQAVEEEQRKTRQVQEKLLQIEREREERYWRNRY